MARVQAIHRATAAAHSEYQGQTYYFCGSACKEKFDVNPAEYAGKPGATPKTAAGCCS